MLAKKGLSKGGIRRILWALRDRNYHETYIYPWGNQFDKDKCNTITSFIKQTTPVDAYPAGASPFGVMDMAGNVWEWCLNGHDPVTTALKGNAKRTVRGGSLFSNEFFAEVADRSIGGHPTVRGHDQGFRVMCERRSIK